MTNPTGDLLGYPKGERRSSGSNGGNGHDKRLREVEAKIERLDERLAGIKETMATREQIQEVKTLIAEREATLNRWLIGIGVGAAGSIILAIVSMSVGLLRFLFLAFSGSN